MFALSQASNRLPPSAGRYSGWDWQGFYDVLITTLRNPSDYGLFLEAIRKITDLPAEMRFTEPILLASYSRFIKIYPSDPELALRTIRILLQQTGRLSDGDPFTWVSIEDEWQALEAGMPVPQMSFGQVRRFTPQVRTAAQQAETARARLQQIQAQKAAEAAARQAERERLKVPKRETLEFFKRKAEAKRQEAERTAAAKAKAAESAAERARIRHIDALDKQIMALFQKDGYDEAAILIEQMPATHQQYYRRQLRQRSELFQEQTERFYLKEKKEAARIAEEEVIHKSYRIQQTIAGLTKQGRFEEARKAIGELQQLDPSSARYYTNTVNAEIQRHETGLEILAQILPKYGYTVSEVSRNLGILASGGSPGEIPITKRVFDRILDDLVRTASPDRKRQVRAAINNVLRGKRNTAAPLGKTPEITEPALTCLFRAGLRIYVSIGSKQSVNEAVRVVMGRRGIRRGSNLSPGDFQNLVAETVAEARAYRDWYNFDRSAGAGYRTPPNRQRIIKFFRYESGPLPRRIADQVETDPGDTEFINWVTRAYLDAGIKSLAVLHNNESAMKALRFCLPVVEIQYDRHGVRPGGFIRQDYYNAMKQALLLRSYKVLKYAARDQILAASTSDMDRYISESRSILTRRKDQDWNLLNKLVDAVIGEANYLKGAKSQREVFLPASSRLLTDMVDYALGQYKAPMKFKTPRTVPDDSFWALARYILAIIGWAIQNIPAYSGLSAPDVRTVANELRNRNLFPASDVG